MWNFLQTQNNKIVAIEFTLGTTVLIINTKIVHITYHIAKNYFSLNMFICKQHK